MASHGPTHRGSNGATSLASRRPWRSVGTLRPQRHRQGDGSTREGRSNPLLSAASGRAAEAERSIRAGELAGRGSPIDSRTRGWRRPYPRPGSVDVTQSVMDDSVTIHLAAEEEAPESVTVLLDWGRRGRLTLELPYPSLTGAYLAPGGERLPDSSTIPKGATSGVRAMALVPDPHAEFFIWCDYRGTDQSLVQGWRPFIRARCDGSRVGCTAGPRVASSSAELCSRTQHGSSRLPADPYPDERYLRVSTARATRGSLREALGVQGHSRGRVGTLGWPSPRRTE